jgi:hypothetical protein
VRLSQLSIYLPGLLLLGFLAGNNKALYKIKLAGGANKTIELLADYQGKKEDSYTALARAR